MVAQLVTDTPTLRRPTLNRLASEALIEAAGDWKAATTLFQTWVEGDADLLRELAAPAIAGLCWKHVRAAAQQQRTHYWSATAQPNVDQTNGLSAVGATTLMDYPLAGGKRLGDATAGELLAEAETYATLARVTALRGRWLRLIAERLPDGATVESTLSVADVEGLQREVERD